MLASTSRRLEFDLLRYLLDREGRAVDRRAILRDVWGTDWTGGSNVIETVVSALRRKLGRHAGMIETVRGVGYRAAARRHPRGPRATLRPPTGRPPATSDEERRRVDGNPLRSARWFGANDLAGFVHRASLHAEGISRAALEGRPIIGICNSWSELVNCNLHFRGLAEAAKRGVLQAGGLPLEFPTIGLGENLMKPTTMLYRNLMAMDVEECIRAYPLDAIVLLGGCDKTVPAQLMGAISAGVPAIMVTGGPAQAAYFRGRELGAGTDLWHYADELRAGRMSMEAFAELEAAATPSFGHCNELGTASTMTALVEALGMCLPGTSTIPAVDAARMRAAEQTGTRAVALAREGLSPAKILTAESLDNAITLLMALGGGTNAVVHLLALAGRLGVPLTLDRFDELSRRTPVIGNLRPSGEHLFEHLHRAGGVQAVLRELAPLLADDAMTVTGRTLGDGYADAEALDRAVIASARGAVRRPRAGSRSCAATSPRAAR